MHEQDMIALLQQHDERGMDALLARVTVVLAVLFAVITIAIARMTS